MALAWARSLAWVVGGLHVLRPATTWAQESPEVLPEPPALRGESSPAFEDDDEEEGESRWKAPAVVPMVHVGTLVFIAGVGADFDLATWFVLGAVVGYGLTGPSYAASARLRLPLVETPQASWALTLEVAHSMWDRFTYPLEDCDERLHSSLCEDVPVRVHERPRFTSALIGWDALTSVHLQVRGYVGVGELVAQADEHTATRDGETSGWVGDEDTHLMIGVAVGYRFEL